MLSGGIEMDVNAEFPKDCNITSDDLCVILFNLLDNAMEACQHYIRQAKTPPRIEVTDCRYTSPPFPAHCEDRFRDGGRRLWWWEKFRTAFWAARRELSDTTWSGVDIVDAILNHTVLDAKRQGIEMDVNAEFPGKNSEQLFGRHAGILYFND